ncbi:MAG: hypothetical protein Q9192_006861 [Flavoplaca navasiana]
MPMQMKESTAIPQQLKSSPLDHKERRYSILEDFEETVLPSPRAEAPICIQAVSNSSSVSRHSGRQIRILGFELWVLHEDLKVNELTIVSKTGRLRDQLAGKEPVPPSTPNAMAKFNINANEADVAANENVARNDVVVMFDGKQRLAGYAFADVPAAANQG